MSRLLVGISLSLLFLLPVPARADGKAVEARNGLVVSVSAPGSDVGLAILKQGGNAVDAAVATAFALAVTYPQAGNIGGGGFMVIHPAPGKGDPVVIEYRETAPAAATTTMFGKDDSLYGHKVVGVPGTVAGMARAHQKFGKLPWRDVVLPAVRLAEEGFALDEYSAGSLNSIVSSSCDFPELQRVLGKNGKPEWNPGDRLVQKDLAWSLRQIAEHGPDAFYKGAVADKLVAEMKPHGLITKEDLAAYRAMERKPIHGTYRGYDVYGPPPPSSGGICLVGMLNVLEQHDLKKMGRNSPETLHLMAETMRRLFCERAKYLGDPGFTEIPAHLTDKGHARRLAATINPQKATRSEDLAKGLNIPLEREGDSTTHFSVIDKDGMAVANTYTLERSYGSRVVVKGAGFLLNNEMMDFNWRPGITDRKGGIGTPPNQIAPGKRMLSSQTPTILAKDGKVVLVTGSPGSRTIINTVLCVVINVVDFEMNIRDAVDAPRLHHQWFPDALRLEGTLDQRETVEKLRKLGHNVSGTKQGDAHSIRVDPRTGLYHGAEDRRISGKAAGY